MPSKRTRVGRVADAGLDRSQIAFLLGEARARDSDDIGLMEYNHYGWLWRALERKEPAGVPLPDGTVGPVDLWAMYGADALELWHQQHGDEPHPLVEYLGLPARN